MPKASRLVTDKTQERNHFFEREKEIARLNSNLEKQQLGLITSSPFRRFPCCRRKIAVASTSETGITLAGENYEVAPRNTRTLLVWSQSDVHLGPFCLRKKLLTIAGQLRLSYSSLLPLIYTLLGQAPAVAWLGRMGGRGETTNLSTAVSCHGLRPACDAVCRRSTHAETSSAEPLCILGISRWLALHKSRGETLVTPLAHVG